MQWGRVVATTTRQYHFRMQPYVITPSTVYAPQLQLKRSQNSAMSPSYSNGIRHARSMMKILCGRPWNSCLSRGIMHDNGKDNSRRYTQDIPHLTERDFGNDETSYDMETDLYSREKAEKEVLPRRFQKLTLPLVQRNDSHMRLDRWLKLYCCHKHDKDTVTQSALQKIERRGGFAVVRHDGSIYRRVSCNFRVLEGDRVCISYPHALAVHLFLKSKSMETAEGKSMGPKALEETEQRKFSMPPAWLEPSDILFTNQDVIVLDKPAGVNSMPASGPSISEAFNFMRFLPLNHKIPGNVQVYGDIQRNAHKQRIRITSFRSIAETTSCTRPSYTWSQLGFREGINRSPSLHNGHLVFPEKPRLVHRLDKDVQGVLVLARNRAAASNFGENLKVRDHTKRMCCISIGF